MDAVSIYDPARWVIRDRRYDCFMGRPIDEKKLFSHSSDAFDVTALFAPADRIIL